MWKRLEIGVQAPTSGVVDLYPAEVRRLPMEDVVEKMRGDVRVEVVGGDALRFTCISPDPKKARDAADRLASHFIDMSLQHREVLISVTRDFLKSQIEATHRALLDHGQQLERARIARDAVAVRLLTVEEEVLAETYPSLLAKAAEVELAANLERRQIGEQFKVLERAGVPAAPLGPSRLALTIAAAVVGLMLGLALAVVLAVRTDRPAQRATS